MDLNKNLGKSTPDNLITDIYPPAAVVSVTIPKQSAETEYKRGTLLGADGTTGELYTVGTDGHTLTPSYVLAEDIVAGTTAATVAVAYQSGCFSKAHVIVADDYTLTASDIDELRKRNIVFKDFM
mgnify:CR=1 FL=1